MHELAIARGILVEVLEVAQEAGAGRITAIELVSGDFSSLAEESLQFSFDMLSGGTQAEGAVLRFRRAEDTVTCGHCGHQAAAGLPLHSACPHCGSPRLQVIGGEDLYVASIEVEEADAGYDSDPEFE